MTKYIRESKSKQKHKAIFQRYTERLKELGEKAPYYSKVRIYEEISDEFFCSAKHIQIVISKALKRGKNR